nr:hypothetical protein [Geminicoccus flavidas]
MPDVVVSPTLRPRARSTRPIIRTVVDLPFVPVTAMTGMRVGTPRGNSISITGRATLRGRPSEGWRCMRKPGAAFTSTMPPPVSWTERLMSGAMKSMPATSKPTACAARRAIVAFSGWMSSVRSIAVPPVERLAVSRKVTTSPASGTLARVSPDLARSLKT